MNQHTKQKPHAVDPHAIQTKVWGWMREVFKDNKYRLVDAFAKAGGYCSLHRHDFQSNTFIVKTGKLRIFLFVDPGTKHTDVITLDRGRTTYTVPPGVRHSFDAIADCEFAELYVGYFGKAPDDTDIVRESEGGLRQR